MERLRPEPRRPGLPRGPRAGPLPDPVGQAFHGGPEQALCQGDAPKRWPDSIGRRTEQRQRKGPLCKGPKQRDGYESFGSGPDQQGWDGGALNAGSFQGRGCSPVHSLTESREGDGAYEQGSQRRVLEQGPEQAAHGKGPFQDPQQAQRLPFGTQDGTPGSSRSPEGTQVSAKGTGRSPERTQVSAKGTGRSPERAQVCAAGTVRPAEPAQGLGAKSEGADPELTPSGEEERWGRLMRWGSRS